MKRKYLSIPLFVLMLSTVLSIPLHLMPASALPLAGPSLVVDDSINRINATLGINSGSQITAKGTIKNIGAVTLTNLLTGVFFIEGTGVLVPADFSFEYSPDGITWFPIHPSEVKVPTPAAAPMQVELVVGSPGGETLAPNATQTMYLRMTLNNNMSPIGWPTNIIQSMTVWVYGDTNLNRQYDGGEIIYSQPPAYGGLVGWDNPIKIDLSIVHTAEIAGTGKFHYSIQSAINAANPGDTIWVYPGTYTEALDTETSLTIQAITAGTVVIKGSQMFVTDYGSREAVIFVKNAPGVTLKNLDVEGQGLGVPGGTKSYGILFQNSTGTILGSTVSPNTIGDMFSSGISSISHSNLTVQSCTIKNFGRVGVYSTNANIDIDNTEIIGQVYSLANLVNYGIEIEDYDGPSVAQITGNNIHDCNNTNPSPLWSSAAIIVDIWRQFYDLLPSTVTIRNNKIHDNYLAIEIVSSDLSYAHYNNISNNLYGVYVDSDLNNNYATFDARFNWWGDASGPNQATTNPSGLGNDAGDYVDYSPWLGKTVGNTPMTWHVNPTGTIQEAIDEAKSGDTIIVHSGTYTGALYITKSLTIQAASTPIIQGSQLFATNYGNRQAVIFVRNAQNVILKGLDIEGLGLGIPGGIKSYAVLYENSTGKILDCTISPNTAGDMYSVGIAAWDNSNLAISRCTIKNFGRIGIYSNHATTQIDNNIIIGQVYNLDNLVNYGIEIEDYSGPSTAVITQNIIHDCNNTNPNPLWSSAAIIVDTWREWADVYGLTLLPSKVSITYNTIYNNYESIELVANDLSYAFYNNFTNNAYGVVSAAENFTTHPTYYVFDARFNWWGDASGPHHTTSWMYKGNPYGPHLGLGDKVSDYVLYDPWTGVPTPTFSVQPDLVQKQMLNVTFSVDITLSDLREGFRAIAVQFRLLYDDTLLQLVNVTEGPFMQDPRWNHYGTMFFTINETTLLYGPHVLVGIVLSSDGNEAWDAFPSGNGTLATITFQAIVQGEPGEPPLTCGLTLADTMIVREDLGDVPTATHSGQYQMLPTHVADLNRDYKVDIKDVSIAARAFGTTQGDWTGRWNPIADINRDGKIDIKDVSFVARNFSWRALDDP